MAYAEKRVSTAKGSKGKVSWRARYKKPDGTWGSEPGFPTKKTAENWGDEQEAAIRSGRWIDPDLMQTPFGVFARKWMASQSPRGRTVMNRWERLDTHILPKWEHTPLIALNWFDVDAWARSLACAESTVKDCTGLLSLILTGAVDAKYLSANPLYGRRSSTNTSAATVPDQPTAGDVQQWAPPEAVLQVARRLGPVNGLLPLTTAFLGPRWGEGIGLHRTKTLLQRREPYNGGWFECPILRIDVEVAEYVRRGPDGSKQGVVRQLEPPKNKWSVRDIDVPPFLADLLARHLATWPHPYVFMTPSGTWWWRNSWWELMRPAADGRPARPKARGRAVKEAWEPIMRGMTMRRLRHTHDTYQAQIGVHPVLAFEQAGHRYPGIKGTYQHPTPKMRQQRLDGLQEIFEQAMRNLGWRALWESEDPADFASQS
ncbi:hypothetical protein [Streptomyces lydicus]|uniref:hypothetical protein n=1 Tax=Streptomyces lydicus TaxID=47763 RepID=UPI0010139D8E|nr:hypothetical protein [Streptomyces lydicus]MCZ1006392.1 hypothetical protein [Streptomyces lydicus]